MDLRASDINAIPRSARKYALLYYLFLSFINYSSYVRESARRLNCQAHGGDLRDLTDHTIIPYEWYCIAVHYRVTEIVRDASFTFGELLAE